MVSTQRTINWEQNVDILINPRWPLKDQEFLTELGVWATEHANLDASFWIATSGTSTLTSEQIKLVGIEKDSFLNSARSVNQFLHSTSGDRWALALPIFHVGGLSILARAHLSDSQVFNYSEPWHPDHFVAFCNMNSITLTSLVPTQIFDLVIRKLEAPSTLRAVFVGGATCSAQLLTEAKKLHWPLLPTFGMTETSSQIAVAPLETCRNFFEHRMRLLPHVQIRNCGSHSSLIQVKSESLFSYYAITENQSMKLIDPKIDGWFQTEDEGYLTEDGFFQLKGRHKNFFKIGGESTSLSRLQAKLDEALLELMRNSPKTQWPQQISLNSFAVLNVPCDRLENKIYLICPFDHLLTNSELSSLVDMFNSTVLPFEKIKKIHLVKRIPTTHLGKVKIAQLRENILKIIQHSTNY